MVLADGCFDPLHYGHILYLVEAAALGPVTVRIAPDIYIIATKGRPPFQSQAERARTILALRMVESVCDDHTLAGAIQRLKPTYLIKGDDWQGRLPLDVIMACEETGTIVVFANPRVVPGSTERLHV